MVHKMKKEFMELEAQARKMEVFVDYEPAAPVGSLFAMKCVVSDKKGARICRFAADADIATAQEHAGYMALSAYFNKEVDESLYIVRTGASEAQTQNTSNVTQGQNQANQAAGGNSRTQQNAGTSRQNGQNVPPQQGRPSAVNQQQNSSGTAEAWQQSGNAGNVQSEPATVQYACAEPWQPYSAAECRHEPSEWTGCPAGAGTAAAEPSVGRTADCARK